MTTQTPEQATAEKARIEFEKARIEFEKAKAERNRREDREREVRLGFYFMGGDA